jgi:hypothetical protein
MKELETKFENGLEALHRDAIECARFAYTSLAFQYVGLNDPHLIDRLNVHAAFWTAVDGALETATQIALGRVYDRRKDVFSANRLLELAEESVGLFSAVAIRARAERRGIAPAAAAGLVAGFADVTRDGFRLVRRALDVRTCLYKERLQGARHKVYAHSAQLTPQQRAEFLLFHRHIERLSVFPGQLYAALFHLYYNAIPPRVERVDTLISKVVGAARARAQSRTTGPEHVHAVASTLAFLNWLSAQAPPVE